MLFDVQYVLGFRVKWELSCVTGQAELAATLAELSLNDSNTQQSNTYWISEKTTMRGGKGGDLHHRLIDLPVHRDIYVRGGTVGHLTTLLQSPQSLSPIRMRTSSSCRFSSSVSVTSDEGILCFGSNSDEDEAEAPTFSSDLDLALVIFCALESVVETGSASSSRCCLRRRGERSN